VAGPWEQYGGMEEPVPQEGYSYGQLPERVAQSPEEVAQTAQIEARDQTKNLGRVNEELARKGLVEKQTGPLKEEQTRLSMALASDKLEANGPWSQYAAPEAAAPAEPQGFMETLKNPWQLWTQESLPAHLASAYKKGVFDKPVGELVHGAAEAVKDFSVKGLVEAAKANPGRFAGEFVNTVVADPYLLLPVFWEALGGRLAIAGGSMGAKLGATAAKVGAAVGRAAEVGLTGAGVGGAVSAADQLDKAGFIDPSKLGQDMKIGAAMAAGLSGMLTVGGMMVKAKPSGLADEVAAAVARGEDAINAARDSLVKGGMEKSKAQDLADAAAPYRDEAAAERLAAQERITSGEAKGHGEEPSALAAREEFLSAKKSLTPSQAKELTDIQAYRSVLPELGVGEKAADVMTPSQAKAWIERKLPEAPLDTFAKIEGPKVLEEAQPPAPGPKERSFPDTTVTDITDALRDRSIGQKIGKAERDEVRLYMSELTKGPVSNAVGEKISEAASAAKGGADFEEVIKHLEDAHQKHLQDLRGGAANEAFPKVDKSLQKFTRKAAAQMEAERRGLPPGWKERGVFDPEMAKWVAVGLGGAALGGYLSDDKGKGAAIGAALALGGGLAAKAGRHLVSEGMEKLGQARERFAALKRDPAIAGQIDNIMSAHEAMTAGISLASDRLAYAIKELVPDAAAREQLIHAIQGGHVEQLKGNTRAAAELFQKEMAEFGDAAQKMGVLDDLIDDGSYVTQLWKDEGKARAYYKSVSGTSRFAEDRLIPSYAKGIELGLEPQTLDIAEIARIYGRSLGKSMANKELLETLKTTNVVGVGEDARLAAIRNKAIKAAKTEKQLKAAEALPDRPRPVMDRADAPADYAPLPGPQMQGMLVHPDMAPSLSYLFHATSIPAYLQAATAVSAAAKQGLLNFSGFHIKSLLEVGLGIGLGLGSPKTLTKIPAMVEMLRKGKAGDFVDQAIRGGLKVDAHGFDMDTSAWAKLSDALISGLEKIPVAGKVASLPVKGVAKLSEGLNHFLWEYLHPAIKLATANVAYTKALEREAGKLAKDATYKALSPSQVMREVAGATNDLFGGLNWRQVSGEIESKFLHNLSASMTNPEGLRLLRVGLLAPDWVTSTVRAGYKGMKATAKSAIPGTKLSVAEDIYRRYFLGGALMTAAVMEGLQQHFTGTHFWDNKDPTMVYLPDGRTIQVAKHFTEIFHWLQDPTGTAVNKLGYVPKEAAAQLLGKEYISTKGAPPMADQSIPGRIGHAVKGMLPIGVQEVAQGRGAEAVSGALGVPIHGRSLQEREEAKRRTRMEIARRRQRQSKRITR